MTLVFGSFICFFLLMFVFWFGVGVVHPLSLGGLFLLVSCLAVACVGLMVGLFPAFAMWVVFIGGILVVFSYSFSLIPFDRGDTGMKGGSFKPGGVKGSYVNKYKVGGSIFYSFFMGFLGLGFFLLIVGDSFSWSYFFRCDSFYYSLSWSVAVVGLGCLLLSVMVAVVCITSKFKGALIG